MVIGTLQNVNASTATGLSASIIPYISCDEPSAMKTIGDSFNATDAHNILAAVLYSQLRSHCTISEALAAATWLNLLTVSDIDVDQARLLAGPGFNDSAGNVQISADLTSLPPGTRLQERRKGSPIRKSSQFVVPCISSNWYCASAMIILYALTSMITVLLLIVIVGGAIKARRHPERYGPRARLIGRPRQSRAKGIAIAMLETLPIVRFGDPDPKQAKSFGAGEDVEMTRATAVPAAEDKGSKLEQPAREVKQDTPALVTDTPRPSTPQATWYEAASSATKTDADPSAAAVPPQDSDSSKEVRDSPNCSICTEDFTLGEELRVLPCNHKFHPLCVDPWLLNVSGTCPLCRIDLRPPQEGTNEIGDTIMAAFYPPFFEIAQQRSPLGGIVRGTMALELQSMVEANREDRIRILRRWREERRSHQTGTEGSTANANSDANVGAHRRSRPISQRLRDSFWVRPSHDTLLSPTRNDVRPTAERRPNTWYAGEAGPTDQPPQSAPSHTKDGRARTWYADTRGVAQRRPSDPRRRSLDAETQTPPQR